MLNMHTIPMIARVQAMMIGAGLQAMMIPPDPGGYKYRPPSRRAARWLR